ncbi:putative lysophospholipase (lpl) protein [Rutstroemia sp. NJR-2017a BBW]|nr:putative lysophospholipase (lpl) protein [Rutstroemia sp. NJR-2017a BBW]
MKSIYTFLHVVAVITVSHGASISAPSDFDCEQSFVIGDTVATKRGAPDSPTGGYAPGNVDCPLDRPTIRPASALSSSENEWLLLRRNKTIAPMIAFLDRANISGFNASDYIVKASNDPKILPNIGIAISGGGYRAMLNGAGFVAAADSRTANSTNVGGIGGLLQSTTYLSGLSGGAWLVGSIYINNFSTVTALRDGSSGSSVWQFGNSILKGPESSGLSIGNTADYYNVLVDDVDSKSAAGYETTVTDYWGRALSFQLVNASNGGPAYTFSSIAQDETFLSGDSPFPVLVADGRAPGTTLISLNSTVYEFNPFELGSWDPTTYGFAPLRYIGSNFSGGAIPPKLSCVRGFDQVGFVGSEQNDVALFKPNPFFGYNNETNENSQSLALTLVDGGEDGQNIPLSPLIQPFRALDVVFAIDSSADTTFYWPNGTSLSNFSTFKPTYNNSERDQMIQNGYNVATLGNGTVDSEWLTCVGCAVISRSLFKTHTAVPAACVACFYRYCWNGTVNSTLPKSYEPLSLLKISAGNGDGVFNMVSKVAVLFTVLSAFANLV